MPIASHSNDIVMWNIAQRVQHRKVVTAKSQSI